MGIQELSKVKQVGKQKLFSINSVKPYIFVKKIKKAK